MQRGSLKQVLDGKGVKVWRAQWREAGKGRTRILGRVLDLNHADARALLDTILEPLQGKQPIRASSITVGAFVESEYLPTRSRSWKTSTRLTTAQIIQTHIMAEFGSRLLCEVTRRDLQAFLDRKADEGYSSSVVGHLRWQLTAIFELAAADGLVRANPAGALVSPRFRTIVDKTTATPEDVRRAQMVLDDRECLLWKFTALHGMRPGEVVGLKIGDIRDGVVHIQRRIYRGTIDTPKSAMSRRKIPLSKETLALLDRYVAILVHAHPEAWLFPSENSETPISYSNFYRRRIQPRLKEIGLGHLNAQILRRTWVSEFAEAEPDAKLRASLAGHSVDVSENVYRQPPAAALKKAMNRLAKRLQ